MTEDTQKSEAQSDGDESRLDRELIELLNEIRVALPGVQVLFAFLLTVPFTNRFAAITAVQRDVYFGILILAAIATALFLAPASFHRIRFRQGDKEALLRIANRTVILGMAALGIAISAAVFLIGDLLFSRPFALTVGVGSMVFVAALWYALPIARSVRDEGAPAAPGDGR